MTQVTKFASPNKSTNVRFLLSIWASMERWFGRWQDRRRLAAMDLRTLGDLGISAGQAAFEVARKPWQEETGLGKNPEVGVDCPPRKSAVVSPSRTDLLLPARTVHLGGLPVGFRPVFAEDKEPLRDFLNGLSERSRTLRFLVIKHFFSDREIDRLCRVDQTSHVAWVAVDLSAPQEKILGEVRFAKTEDDPNVAEFGVAVADAFQGRGLGRLLMEVLADEAQRCGVQSLRGYVSETNALMLGYVMHRGGTMALDFPGVMQVDLPVSSIRAQTLAAE